MSREEVIAEAGEPASIVGRKEESRGCLTPELAAMLNAAVAHERSFERDLRSGCYMPCLWHWAAFPDFVPMAELGRDGHPALGRFLPDLGLSRRMWAGGKVTFAGVLRIGAPLHRRSEIVSVARKNGAAGPMAFVKVRHIIEGEVGARVEEDQDIVYLDIPDRFSPPRKVPVADAPGFEAPDFDETVPMTEARLFRFSAATFNAHRIHYDLPYARDVEKYPALVVHGPMQAIMLIEAGKRHFGQLPARFRYRSLHPMFHDHDLRLVGHRSEDGRGAELGAASTEGHLTMQARMEWD